MMRKGTLTLFCTVLLCSSFVFVQCQAQATSKSILGMIVPGRTTLSAFEDALDNRECEFKETRLVAIHKERVVVEEGCFDLPGNPTVVVDASSNAPADVITNLWIDFQNSGPNSAYASYFNALKKSYGNPFHFQDDTPGNRAATWIFQPSLLITLEEKGEEGNGSLTYSIGKEAKEFLDRLGIKPSPSRQRKPKSKPEDISESPTYKDLSTL
ncbi:MAG: hypothetical protein LUC43_05525 [Burkholderiales bacterium]|nr:hypothetical protein [Burkholderiales bacterium]